MALLAAVDAAVAAVAAATASRFELSHHVPDGSVSSEGFDLETWRDLCQRSRPAGTGTDEAAQRRRCQRPTKIPPVVWETLY